MASNASFAAAVPPAAFSMRAILVPLVAIVIGTFMAILDTTVVNVALPTLSRVFGTDLHVLQWVITGYMLAQAAVIPLAGWFSDRFGAKRLYVASLVLFTLGSTLCALAPSAQALIFFRVLQGLGGGMLMPVGMTFLYRLAPPDRRGAVMGAFGIPILLAPAIGPVLSGWLIEYSDWRLIFLINLPVGIAAVLVGLRALPSMAAQRAAGALDLPGIVLGPLAFAALSFGISSSTTAGWAGRETLGAIGIGLVALIGFAARELTAAEPLLDLRVFRGGEFSRAIATSWIAQTAMFGTFFLVPVFLQQVRGYGSFETGLFTLPQAITAALFMPIGGRLFDRFGVRPPVVAGLTLLMLAMWQLSTLTGQTRGEDLRLPLALWGAGMGLLLMPLNTHLLNSAPRDLVSRVTSLTGALQNVVASLAVASAATILQTRLAVHMAPAPAGLAPGDPIGAGLAALAYGDTYRVAMVAALIAIGLGLTLGRRRAAPAVERDPAIQPAPVAL